MIFQHHPQCSYSCVSAHNQSSLIVEVCLVKSILINGMSRLLPLLPHFFERLDHLIYRRPIICSEILAYPALQHVQRADLPDFDLAVFSLYFLLAWDLVTEELLIDVVKSFCLAATRTRYSFPE